MRSPILAQSFLSLSILRQNAFTSAAHTSKSFFKCGMYWWIFVPLKCFQMFLICEVRTSTTNRVFVANRDSFASALVSRFACVPFGTFTMNPRLLNAGIESLNPLSTTITSPPRDYPKTVSASFIISLKIVASFFLASNGPYEATIKPFVETHNINFTKFLPNCTLYDFFWNS